jgi:glutathione S-transferase
MPYCSSSDLQIAVGGSPVLVQLLDKDGDGVADSDQIAACLARATAEANSALQVVIDIDSLSAPYPDALIYNTAAIAAYLAWLQGGEGQTMPDAIKAAVDDARRWLDQVARRERTLGTLPKPATGQQVEQVDRNPEGADYRVLTWNSSAGAFW